MPIAVSAIPLNLKTAGDATIITGIVKRRIFHGRKIWQDFHEHQISLAYCNVAKEGRVKIF